MRGLSRAELPNRVLSMAHMENGNTSDESWGRGCALLEAIDAGARAEADALQTFLRAEGITISAHL